MLAKPLTFMNRSGDVVAALTRYYDVRPTSCWWSSTTSTCRSDGCGRGPAGRPVRTTGCGRSSIDWGREFPRLRLGVGRGDARRDLADHVPAKFEPGERAELESFITRAADAAEMFAAEGIVKVMNTYNADDAESDN